MAPLIRIAAELGAIAAAHVALELVDGRRLRPADDVKRDGLVRLAAEAAHFKISVSRIARIAERRGRLRRAAQAQHPLVPGITGETVGFPPCRLSALCGRTYRATEHPVAGFCAHSS